MHSVNLHSHRGKEQFPGMTITYALMSKYEDFCDQFPDRAQLVKKANVTKILYENGKTIGVVYEKDGASHKAMGRLQLLKY